MSGRVLLIAICALVFVAAIEATTGRAALTRSFPNGVALQDYVRDEGETRATCQAVNEFEIAALPLRGRVVHVSGRAQEVHKAEIKRIIEQRFRDSEVYVDDVQQRAIRGIVSHYMRGGVPVEAVTVEVEERGLNPPRKLARQRTLSTYHQVTIRAAGSAVTARWQGVLGNTCGELHEVTPFAKFIEAAAAAAGDTSPPNFAELYGASLEAELVTIDADYVARRDEFSAPLVADDCLAYISDSEKRRAKRLTVPTTGGTVTLEPVATEPVPPAVVCSAGRTVLVVRNLDRIAVVAVDRDGSLLGATELKVANVGLREAFRDAQVDGDRVSVALVAYAVNDDGRLVATSTHGLNVYLPPPVAADPGEVPKAQRACLAAPLPELARIPLHEFQLNALGGSGLVRPADHRPISLRYLVVDALYEDLALSIRGLESPSVFYVTVVPGTRLRYIEVVGRGEQIVVVDDAETIVNVATAPDCPSYIDAEGRARDSRVERVSAAAQRSPRKVMRVVGATRSDPAADWQAVDSALQKLGYTRFRDSADYFSTLARSGLLVEPSGKDFVRLRQLYYEGLPTREKLWSWFSARPGLDLRAHFRVDQMRLVKAPLALPDLGKSFVPLSEPVFIIEAGVPLPDGDVYRYMVLDVTTLSCKGQVDRCPWRGGARD
ncbi:MAG: hypothetical protein AB7Q81_22995 [Gammaproteobacteria bacterium]